MRAADGLKVLVYFSEHASWHLRQPVQCSGITSIRNFDNLISLNPDFAFKKRKNLIRSKSQSRSLEGPIKLAFHKGCEIEILNGPNLKTIP